MKLKNIISIVLTGVIALSVTSCAEFLNRPSVDGYNTSNFYLNDEQCLQGVNYLYNSPWYDFQRGFIKVGEVMAGNMYWGDCPYLTFTTNSTDKDLVNMSYSLWAVNGHCNAVINNIVAAEGPTKAGKEQAIGEALSLKALAYFFLVRSFGEVPIVHNNSELLEQDYNNINKATRENVYDYIIYTLETAMNLLPKKTSGFDNRIDYYAAEALMAKVYLTKAGVTGTLNNDDLVKAKELALDVILNSGRKLTPKYSDIFRLAPATYNQTGEPLISWMWTGDRSHWTCQNTLQSDLFGEGFSETGDLWGGWGGPSYDLLLAFDADPLEDPATRVNEKDSRRKCTAMMVGDKYEYFWTDKGGFDLVRYIYDKSYANCPTGSAFQGPCGAQNCKHLYGNTADHEAALGTTPDNMAYTLPTHIVRLGDIYLVCAEAALLTGDATTALTYLNAVRARAGVDELAAVTYDDIWKERRLELAGEGDRWYDYVRRSYYDAASCIAELKAQKRNEVYSYGKTVENYVMDNGKYKGPQTWELDPDTKYNDTASNIIVNQSVFTLPFPQEDVVYNPNLLKDAVEVNVRETYKYNF